MSANGSAPAAPTPRPPAVAGLFYPDNPDTLAELVDGLLQAAGTVFAAQVGGGRAAAGAFGGALPVGILVPHAGLAYSGLVAAAAWRLLAGAADAPPLTLVLLGTNHGAAWLTGVGAWDAGPWRTPLGDVAIDGELAAEIIGLGPPFGRDLRCHVGEHSLEVQLPFVRRVTPAARVVPLSVGTGTGARAVEAGGRLGGLLARRRATGARDVLVVSTDMAHYPPAEVAERVTAGLLPRIVGLDPEALAQAEAHARRDDPATACGMCGIEPSVLGLAALRAMGAGPGAPLAAATSADAGGDPDRTVGYLAVAFPAG